MKFFSHISFYLILLSFASCTDQDLNLEPLDTIELSISGQDPLSRKKINELIEQQLSDQGDFDWNSVSGYFLWSALQHGDYILTIGYGSDKGDFTNSKSQVQSIVKSRILDLVETIEEKETAKTQKKDENILIYDDEYLTIIDVKVTQLETILKLREDANIRYMEPSGYHFLQQDAQAGKSLSESGCGFESEVLSGADYSIIAPNAKMPWNFRLHHIDSAWEYSTGRGVTIGIVDTGLSPDQPLLNNNFNNGYSSGRSLEKRGVYVNSYWPWSKKTDGPNDKCGHGTKMASVATAPRNNMNRPVGVAYNANLVSYRASKNVLLNSYQEQKGVARAITELGRRNDVKIISMSMGYIFSIGRIKDAIRYAHRRGKLIFVAGGTSTTFTNFMGVTFPGTMSETIAVTGVEEGAGYNECDTCHYGGKIDYTIVMERSSGNNHVPVLGYYNRSDDYVGGSSVATATAAGIAALVWSKNPNWTRDQVLHQLTITADLYPNKSGNFGWGNLNALNAVR
ncbi:putative secreted serine protease [hydrothermal vent metagenome]|uniref:Putative secreted serine protease n=1 Tax=hydrothermal vent metagenome TaxID=652676 RepID=A0A3B0TRM2_9ZZZZ